MTLRLMYRSGLLLALVTLAVCEPVAIETCSARPTATIYPDANVFLGGLFDFNTGGDTSYGCNGPSAGTMQEYEAVRWALARINQDSGTINNQRISDSYIPGVKLGMKVGDTCTQSRLAIDSVLGFYPELASSVTMCTSSNTTQAMAGLLSNTGSSGVAAVSDVLKRYEIPHISAAATAPSLSDNTRYPYFMRTVPTDRLQVQTMLAVLKELGWTNTAIVYTDGPYGTEGYNGLRQGALNAGICITQAIKLPESSTSEALHREALTQLVDGSATGVVYFGDTQTATNLLDAAFNVPNSGNLQWLMSESIGGDSTTVTGRNYARGMLTVAPASRQIAEFEDYWVKLSTTSQIRDNPWYLNWYMNTNRCRLPGVNYAPYNRYNSCPVLSEFQRRSVFQQGPYVEPAIVAVFTYAKAIKTARDELCPDSPRRLCNNFLRMSSAEFHEKYMKNVDFTFSQEERIPTLASTQIEPYRRARRVRYDGNGDIMNPSYAVYNYNDRTGTFKFNQVGTFSDGGLTLNRNQLRMYDSSRNRPLSTIPRSSCPPAGCGTCLTGGATYNKPAFIPGDIVLGGLFSVHQPGSTSLSCGQLNMAGGAELVEAFLYGLQHAKNQNYWRQNVKLGMLAFDDCSSSELAENLLKNFESGEDVGASVSADKVASYMAGNTDAITLAVASLLGAIPKPQLGYKAPAGLLTDSTMFPFFANIVPSKADGINAVIQLLKKLGVSNIRMVHDNTDASGELLQAFRLLTVKDNICVDGVGFSMPNNYQGALSDVQSNPETKVMVLHGSFSHFEPFLAALNRTNDAEKYLLIPSEPLMADKTFSDKKYKFRTLTWTLKAPTIAGWSRYLNSLTPDEDAANPWLSEWYQSAYNCYLDANNRQGYSTMCQNVASRPISSAPGFTSNPYSGYVVMGVGALARALDKTLEQICGASYTTVCSRFVGNSQAAETMMRLLREDPLLNGDWANGYDIQYMRPGAVSFTKIGDVQYENDPDNGRVARVTITAGQLGQIGTVSSTCSGLCTGCLYMYEHQPSMYLPGDVLLAGLFNVHYRGDNAFSCGDIRSVDGFQYSEAFRYAIGTVNDKSAPVSLNGIQLGGLALDGCSSDMRSADMASSIYSGAVMPTDNNGMPIDINTIKGWLMYTSDVSIQAAYILGRLGIGAISPSASSVSLNDQDKYPTFYRTVPADDKQAAAMAKLVDYLGWSYIQSVNAPNTYGRTGIEAFQKALQKTSTCSINSLEYGTDGDADSIIAKLLASSTSVVVVFGGESMINELLEAKAKAGNPARDLVFVTSEKINDGLNTRNTLAFSVDTPTLQNFNTYLAGMKPGAQMPNPWFNEVYQDLYQCNLPGNTKYNQPCLDVNRRPITDAPGYQQDVRVLTTVNAVYALVQAIDLALKERCGLNYNGVCPSFMAAGDSMALIVRKLDEVAFPDPSGSNLQFVDRQHDRGYALYRYGSNGDALRVGTFRGSSLLITDQNLASSYGFVTSQCQGTCTQCQYKAQEEEEFTFQSGDILLAGLFDVHSSGQGAFSCGDVNIEQGWQLVEAFNFAIERVNNKTGTFNALLPGVKLGGVALDTCASPTRAANLVANVQSGLLPLTVGNSRVNPDRVDVYIGAYDSDTSAAVASILNVLGIPQLSYGATATVFKDPKMYPNFLRTVPADDKLARAMVALLKYYNIEYVQVVHSAGTYGDDAVSEFIKLADKSGVCVAQTVRLSEDTPLSAGGAERAVRSLLDKPQALVVITFIATEDINAFLQAVARVPQASRFKFVGSETWANRLDLFEGIGDVAADSLTLGVETADLSSFDRFLRTKTPANYRGNPWFEEYYEAVFDCSLTPGSTKYTKQCSTPTRDIIRAPGYKQDAYVLYTVNAVYSAALGIHMALQESCGQNYYGVCESFRSAGDRREKILDGIKKARFQDATNQQFEFTKDGESNRGYHIYTARRTPGGSNYYYENVGSYNDTHLLKIRPRQEFEVSWKSDCSVPGACGECSILGRKPTRGMERSRPNFNLVGFFDVHASDPKEPLRCGKIQINTGFQNVLAFFYAIDRFNKENRFDVDMGGLAIDTCSSSVRVTQDIYSLLTGQGLCDANGLGGNVDPFSIVGVIPSGDENSQAAASLLSRRGVTMLSPTATADSLWGVPYFMSTIPPNTKQAEAMAALVQNLGLSYISAIHSDSDYGKTGMKSFFKANNGTGVCVGKKLTLAEDATIADAEALLSELSRQSGAKAVALYTNTRQTRLLLQAAKNLGLEDRFTWIGSESWGNDPSVTAGLESAATGSLTLQARSAVIDDFMNYVTSLTVANHGDIPDDWFAEFWQAALKCKLENSTLADEQYARVCAPSDRLSRADIMQGDYVLQTFIATYVAALGLTNADECQSSPLGIAGCLQEKGDDRRRLIYEGVLGTEFEVLEGEINPAYSFRFTPGNFGNTGFTVLNYQRNPNTNQYEYVRVGQMHEGTLNLNDYKPGEDNEIKSNCPPGRTCTCVDYNGQPAGTTGGGGGNVGPVSGRGLNDNLSLTWGIVIAALTCLGILLTLIAFIYLLIAYPIKGGTSVLGYLLIIAVLLMYVLVFAFLLNDVPAVCGIRRFCLGLVYALVFSCMLVKVLNTWRLGAYFSEYLPSYERLAHPCSLVMITLGLTLVQVIIGVEWLILEPPAVELIQYDTMMINRCTRASFYNEALVLSCVYVMVLMLLTLIFAGVTWDSEENHRESRWVLITTCFTIGILIIWTIISTLTEIKYREPAIAIALLVNATILLLAMFVRKIFLLHKYQKEAEEERKSQFAINEDAKDNSYYSTLYNNQAFDTSGEFTSRKGPGSQTGGSGIVYVYDGTTGVGQNTY